MNNKIASDTANSARSLASQIAKQMAREPLEILKTAKEQTAGGEYSNPDRDQTQGQEKSQKDQHDQKQMVDKQRSTRLIEALNRELADIHKQKLFSELQARIANGEEIALEEYPELTMEQKQVLLAQMEAVKKQREMQGAGGFQEVPAVHSKPSRRFGAGQKHEAEKQQTRVEKPVPPSG